jgi:hypothetical protein
LVPPPVAFNIGSACPFFFFGQSESFEDSSRRADGFSAETRLALGDPPEEILKVAEAGHCDRIALTSHGPFFGRPVSRQHHHQGPPTQNVPMLVHRVKKK